MSYIALRFDAGAADAEALVRRADRCRRACRRHLGSARGSGGRDASVRRADGAWRDVVADIAAFRVAVDAGREPAVALREAANALARPMPSHETISIPGQDWVRASQAQFGPIRIADNF